MYINEQRMSFNTVHLVSYRAEILENIGFLPFFRVIMFHPVILSCRKFCRKSVVKNTAPVVGSTPAAGAF